MYRETSVSCVFPYSYNWITEGSRYVAYLHLIVLQLAPHSSHSSSEVLQMTVSSEVRKRTVWKDFLREEKDTLFEIQG